MTTSMRGVMVSCALAMLGCADDPESSASAIQSHESDDDDGLIARATRGLSISPVRMNLAGLDLRQRRLVGLGSYIVNGASDCAGCHSGAAGFLAGGSPFSLDQSGHVVYARNLTPDPSTGLTLNYRQFLESMRTGRDFHSGETRMLVVMPWTTLRWSSERDLRAIYAYLRVIPAVRNAVPPDHKSDLPLPRHVPFPRFFYNDGDVVRLLPDEESSFSSRRGLAISPLALPRHLRRHERDAYGTGSYIANTFAHCNDCHTHPDRTPDSARVNTASFLTGGTVFAVPPPLQPALHQVRTTSANLLGATHGFFSEPGVSYSLFRSIIRASAHVDETPARPLAFPMNLVAQNLANLTEPDLRAVYTYMFLSPRTRGPSDVEHQDYARYCLADSDCATGESCSLATHECVGRACGDDLDCDTCQTCGAGLCAAPSPTSACVLTAQ